MIISGHLCAAALPWGVSGRSDYLFRGSINRRAGTPPAHITTSEQHGTYARDPVPTRTGTRRAPGRLSLCMLPAVLHGGSDANKCPHAGDPCASALALLAGQARVVVLSPCAPLLGGDVVVRGG